MKILAIILLFGSFACQAQKFDSLFKAADKSFTGYTTGNIYYYDHAPDTLECRMLVTSETHIKTIDGDKFIHSAPFVINGYEIFPTFGRTVYLTIDKKPLSKNYTVWISKEKYKY